MTRRPELVRVLSLGVLVASLGLNGETALAKRGAPPEVPPVVYEGVRYEVPPFDDDCGQNGGCIVAYDDATGAQLWQLRVYCTHYDSNLETDVQDVFITSLAVEDGRLNVTNEKGRHFAIDVRSRVVSGDPRGCDAGGCSSTGSTAASVPVAQLALLLLVLVLDAKHRRIRGRGKSK